MKIGYLAVAVLPLVAIAGLSAKAVRAETTECTEITSVPTTLHQQGIYCFKGNLATGISSGNAITIQANNVTIDMNGYKLGGLGGGDRTEANGFYAEDYKNITIRNGTVRGYFYGVNLFGSESSGHVVEDLRIDFSRYTGIQTQGSGHVLRDNQIVATGQGSGWGIGFGMTIASDRTLVANNIVSDTAYADGIRITDAAEVVVRDNEVLGVMDEDIRRGISIANASQGVTVLQNRIVDTSGGAPSVSAGISVTGSPTGIACLSNTVHGFASTGFGNCTTSEGNVAF